jgi:Protein of unknown function (DUF3306)
MSEPENFIARWSRRKAATQDAAARPVAGPAKPATRADGGEAERKESDAAPALGGAPERSAPVFDLTKLPPIESITAETDIRAFLAPGVPAYLTRAALRRAWASDPKIRDFVGLSENSWDFNAPNSIAGFGPLEMTEELRGQIERMLGGGIPREAPESVQAAPPQEMASAAEGSSELAEAAPEMPAAQVASTGTAGDERVEKPALQASSGGVSHRNKVGAVAQAGPAAVDAHPSSAKRLHGGALPK